jgi:DNA processing protein
MTEKITQSLVANGFVICSGLALGIDTCAHSQTLESGGQTIAVLAWGLDSIYPPQNKHLAKKIVENGLLISENLPYTPREKYHFPQRNRIVSGLSKAICVIEGNLQSGALLTAKFALEQSKEIYALPGDIHRAESEGPNYLIANGAKIIMSPDMITKELKNEYKSTESKKEINLNENERYIHEIIKNNQPEIHIDQLLHITNFTIGKLSEVLLMLEMKNAVRTTENGKYALTM